MRKTKTKHKRPPHPARWCCDGSHSVPVPAWSWCPRRCHGEPPAGRPRASSAGGRRPATRPARSRRRPRSSPPSRRASRAPLAGGQERRGVLARVRFCEAKGLRECVWEWEDVEEEGEWEGLWRELSGVGSEGGMSLCDITNINKPRRENGNYINYMYKKITNSSY